MKLNELDRQILQKLADGKNAKTVASEMNLTSHVVYNKLTYMNRKNGCDTTLQLVIKAFREKQIA